MKVPGRTVSGGPVLLGAGKRLFGNLGDQTTELERTGVIESPYATHLFFTVRR